MARHAYDLAGKVVVITGGNGGIGGATARELLKRGAQVAIVDIDPRTPELAATLNPDAAIGLVGDVRDRAALESAVAQTVERFGRLDIAIANAGLLARAATLRVTPATAIENTLAVNVGGVVNTVAASVEEVIANQGQIVLISSVFAFLNGMGTIPYAMSKAAVEQLGRGLRVELADHGVSVITAYFSLVRHRHDQAGRRRGPGRGRAALDTARADAQARHPAVGRCRDRRRPRAPRRPGHAPRQVEARVRRSGVSWDSPSTSDSSRTARPSTSSPDSTPADAHPTHQMNPQFDLHIRTRPERLP